MKNILRMVLPKHSDPKAAEEARKDLEEMKEVKNVRIVRPRSGAAEAMIWISVAANVVGIAATGAGLLEKLRAAFRKRRLEGVHIELPDGVRVSLDSATPEEVQHLVRVMQEDEDED